MYTLYNIESSTLLSSDLTGDDGSKLDRAGMMGDDDDFDVMDDSDDEVDDV